MMACIPTKGNAGLNDTVNDHFGSAACFTLINTETEEVIILNNGNARHVHGKCNPLSQLASYHIDCVVCKGMGRRAIEVLNTQGIKIYQTESDNIREVFSLIKSGSLSEINPATACAGHGDGKSGCAHNPPRFEKPE